MRYKFGIHLPVNRRPKTCEKLGGNHHYRQAFHWSNSRILNAPVALRRGAREREALQLEIAFILRIAIQTLALHSDNIKRSLGLRTRAELTKYMIEQR
jgi:hypothetical protein